MSERVVAKLDQRECQLELQIHPEDDPDPDIDPERLPDDLVEIGDPGLIAAWLIRESVVGDDEQADERE